MSPVDPFMRVWLYDGDPSNLRIENLYYAYSPLDLEEDDFDSFGRKSCARCFAPIPDDRKHGFCRACQREYQRARKLGADERPTNKNQTMTALSRSSGRGYPIKAQPLLVAYVQRQVRGKPMLLREIADTFGVSKGTVKGWLDRYRKRKGIVLTKEQIARFRGRTKGRSYKKEARRRFTEDKKLEAAQYAVKYGAREAGEVFGVSERTIVRWKKSFGLSGKSDL